MTHEARSLALDDKLKAEDLLYGAMFHTRRGQALLRSRSSSPLVLHIVVLLINFPEFKKAVGSEKKPQRHRRQEVRPAAAEGRAAADRQARS